MKKTVFLLFISGLFFTNAQTLNFKHLSDMSVRRGGISSAVADDDIYVSNGYRDNDGNATFIEKYSIKDNRWSVVNAKLLPRRFGNSETDGHKIYIFNGWGNSHLEILDLETNKVTKGAVNRAYTGNAGSDIQNGKIYVFGGSGLNNAATTVFSNRFQYYDIASDTWHPLPDMPTAREAKGKIVDDKLYVIGGFNGTPSRLVNVYDLNKNIWTEQYTMPLAISGYSLAVSGHKIFIAGGSNNQTFLAYFDTETNTLHQLSSNMIPRRHATAEIYNDKLYIIGGSTTSSTKSALKSLQAADISEGALSAEKTDEDSFESKVYTNAHRGGLSLATK